MGNNNGNHDDDKMLSHLLAGLFLCAFGLTFLGLTVIRIRRLVTAMTVSSSCASSPSSQGLTLLTRFLEEHVPERSQRVLKTTSKAIVGATLFGIFYTMVGARFINHDLHPDYTFFHYFTHLTLLLLYLFVGWTGVLETKGYLPADSLRVSLAVSLWGETLLWIHHGMTKKEDLDRILHVYLGLIAGLSAVCGTASVLVTETPKTKWRHRDTDIDSDTSDSTLVAAAFSPPTPPRLPPRLLPFLLYVGVLVGLVWQGIWFLAIAFHLRWRFIPSTGHATALLVLQALVLLVACQILAIAMVRFRRRRRHCQNRDCGNGGKNGYSFVSVKEFEAEPETEDSQRRTEEEDERASTML